MQFPDQSSIGNGNKRPDKIEIDFDDFIVQGLQRNWSRKVKKRRRRNGAGGLRREMENQKILLKLRTMVRLQRKQEVTNKKIMKLIKEMIELHDFMAELQTLTN